MVSDPIISDVSCYGASNANLSVQIAGGVSPTVKWEYFGIQDPLNDTNVSPIVVGTTTTLVGQPPGLYKVSISDMSCPSSVLINEIVVSQPDRMPPFQISTIILPLLLIVIPVPFSTLCLTCFFFV